MGKHDKVEGYELQIHLKVKSGDRSSLRGIYDAIMQVIKTREEEESKTDLIYCNMDIDEIDYDDEGRRKQYDE